MTPIDRHASDRPAPSLGDGSDIDHCCRAIDTFLVLLIGIGPKIALVPFLEMTASLCCATTVEIPWHSM